MFLGFLVICIVIGLIIGSVQNKKKEIDIKKETPALVAQDVKIIATRKYGMNGYITFEDTTGNRFEVLARSGIVPFSTYIVGDKGKLKHSHGELVEFVREV